jgi:hypothetical protein
MPESNPNKWGLPSIVPQTTSPNKWGLPSIGPQIPASPKPNKWGLPNIAPRGGGGVSRSDAIHEMQDAILKLDLLMKGHEAFNAYLISHYLNGAKLDGMGAVGTEGKADGAWGARTDIGLKEVGELAQALSKVQVDMKVPVNMGGQIVSLDPITLLSLIPPSYKEVQNAADTATKLTQHITALTEFYGSIADFMTKKYGDQLADSAEVVKYKGSGLTPDEEDYANKPEHQNEVIFTLPYASKGGLQVRLKDISSPQAFVEFLHNNTTPGAPVPDAKTQAQYILQQLGANPNG